MTALEEERHLVQKFIDEGMIEFIDEQINKNVIFSVNFTASLCIEGFVSEHFNRYLLFEHRQEFVSMLEQLYKDRSDVYWLVAI